MMGLSITNHNATPAEDQKFRYTAHGAWPEEDVDREQWRCDVGDFAT